MIYFVGAGPGDPELITLKGRRLLDEADMIIYAGSLVNKLLFENVKAELYDSKVMTLDEIIECIKEGVEKGKKVVRLHSGDPSIYGAVKEQMVRLDALGIEYEIIPGVTSATAAAAVLKEELTRPEVSQTVIITRHGGRTPVPEKESLKDLASHQATMLIFLSISLIDDVVAQLKQAYPDDTSVAVVEKATWPEERIIRAPLSNIAVKVKETGIKKTAIIVIGDILKHELQAVSKLYDRDFTHEYRT
jgi:precorrin-4/cobalt-precorrin-4 C11-methyltransferase